MQVTNAMSLTKRGFSSKSSSAIGTVDENGNIEGLPFISASNAMQLLENEHFSIRVNEKANTLFH